MSDKDETKGTSTDDSKGSSKDDSKGTPKKDKGTLYSKEAIAKLKSDSASMGQGRAEAIAKQEKAALTLELDSIKSRFDALEDQGNEARLAEARGDPAKLTAYQLDQANRKRERAVTDSEADMVRREGLLKTGEEALKESQGSASIAIVAAKHGLKTAALEELGITDPEALEKVAVKLAAAGKPPETPEEKTAREAKEKAEETGLELDPGVNDGSGELTEKERLDARYPTMK